MTDFRKRKESALGYEQIEMAPMEGTKVNFMSINFCDRTTWYEGSIQVTGSILSNSGDDLTYSGSHLDWIDVCHGKLTGERELRTTYRPVITIGTASFTENDPETQSGDYSINYESGSITWNTVRAPSDFVTASYYYADKSTWTISPSASKYIRIIDIEVQFSEDIELTDTILFQPYGFVEDFAPQYTPVPYPAGTKITLGSPTVYQTMQDYINEANLSYPVIPVLGGSNWRALKKPLYIFRWDYKATTDLLDSKGMEVQISLENDLPFSGSAAIATIYALSFDES